MTRIAFVGAGSVEFTRDLLGDILSFPELAGATIALHDIDPERSGLPPRSRLTSTDGRRSTAATTSST
jgi:alpha-galactosidase/6-phospho-beta-glucosidase family protein